MSVPPDITRDVDLAFAVQAPQQAGGQRIDSFLAEEIGSLSRSRLKMLILEGRVSQNGRVLKIPSEPVRPGATYSVDRPSPVAAQPVAQEIPFNILYEDGDLIVLDKPAGLVVHPAPGNEDGTLVNALLAHCGDSLPGIGGERRPGIVHRLDKDTSGVMVVAKTEMALATLSATFAARDIDRFYLALCWGTPHPPAGEIEGAIGRDPRDRKRMAVVGHGGKPALTRYQLLRAWHAEPARPPAASRSAAGRSAVSPSAVGSSAVGSGVALLECRLATGRTHQIRVHLAAQGYPIVGDPVYLRRIPGSARSVPGPARGMLLDFPRQALHAARLGFAHPRTGQALSFESSPPPDMQALLTYLDTGVADAGRSDGIS